jgi:hypothetical protein
VCQSVIHWHSSEPCAATCVQTFAQYFIPEHAYFEYSEAGFDWDSTASGDVEKFIISETVPLLMEKLDRDGDVPVGPAIGGMPEGQAKTSAFQRFQAAEKKERVEEHKAEVAK